MKIAVQQPYFAPFGGYFRLLSETDLFVILDDVQFPRRGWVHRNQLLNRNGMLRWLTAPLAHAPQDVLIRDLRFSDRAEELMRGQSRHFPAIEHLPWPVCAALMDVGGPFLPYCRRLLVECCKAIGIPARLAYASDLAIPAELRGQGRILEVCRLTGATEYLNAPGGRDLYDPQAFAEAGVDLQFLPPWTGEQASVLQVIADRQRVAA